MKENIDDYRPIQEINVRRKDYKKYKHHGKQVFVREDLKGRHREHCLCFRCKRFNQFEPLENCHIANLVYATCVKYNLVLPVWECPDFKGDVKDA